MAGTAGSERPFIGRPEAVDALRRRSDAVRIGRGGLTIVEGEAGVGKSTLVQGVAREGRTKGMQVLVARAASLESPPPLMLLREALASAAQSNESTRDAETGGAPIAFAPSSGRSLPLYDLLPSAAPGAESWLVDDHLLEPFAGGLEATGGSRHRLDAQLATQFLDLGDQVPTVVILEDLHLADEASLESLAFLAPQLERHSLWVLATRLPLSALAGPRRALLEGVERAGEAEKVVLRPFLASEVAEFIRTLEGGAEVPAEELTRWHSQSGGNPLFLEQLQRRRGELDPRHPIPPGVEAPSEFADYLARQAENLRPEEERVLVVAAILGREFPFSLLLRASGEEEEHLAEIVQELVARGLLRERSDESLEFRRDEMRVELSAKLTEARRRLLHKKAAEALEGHGAADAATIYALARHCYRGRIDDRSAAYNRMAGEFAARSFAPLVARQHFERALESLGRLKPRDPLEELEVSLDLAVQLDHLGELDAAERLLVDALADAEKAPAVPGSIRAVGRVFLARIFADQGRWDEVDRIARELLPLGPGGLTPRTLLALHRLRGETLYFYGRYPESLEQHDRALEIARAQNDRREVALETVRRANVLGMIPGRFEEAVVDYRSAIASLVAQGDNGEAAYAMIYFGVVLSQHGRLEEGLAALEEARGLAEQAHDLRRLGWSLFNIADLEQERGHIEVAKASNLRAREILTRIGDRFGLVQTLIVEGKIRLHSGELEIAEVELLEAFRLVRELNVPADEAEVLLRLAEGALARGDRASAENRRRELERLHVERLRPDLVEDYEKLVERLSREASGPG